jgi:hypothetical protein
VRNDPLQPYVIPIIHVKMHIKSIYTRLQEQEPATYLIPIA